MLSGLLTKMATESLKNGNRIFTGKNGDHEGSVWTSQVANSGYSRFN